MKVRARAGARARVPASRITPCACRLPPSVNARRLLHRAGVVVPAGVGVELAPWILDEADLAAVLPPGSRIDHPTVVGGGG